MQIDTGVRAIKFDIGKRVIEIIKVQFDFPVADIDPQIPGRGIGGPQRVIVETAAIVFDVEDIFGLSINTVGDGRDDFYYNYHTGQVYQGPVS